ncbi:hypothetical protein O3M35_011943 [Rhynocoris fuscipes]|uniref:Uncharacterized protein n=1 Tax=Rhynocoris fuscipes TaxID=488301 RepID=A0AAW1CYE3_9HEMI
MEAKEGINYDKMGLTNRWSNKNIEEERKANEKQFQNDLEFQKNKDNLLECQVYLYDEDNGSANRREALIFHFKHLFNITIEGVTNEKKNIITNMEHLGLPTGFGNYFNLTPTIIKCIPSNVIKCSKGNKFNNTGMRNPRDWIYQALAGLGFDNLVTNINQHKYQSSYPPSIEPRPTLYDSMRDMVAGAMYKLTGDMDDHCQEVGNYNKKESKKKMPVQLPNITVPHVPSEYDEKERIAVVVRYNKNNECGILFHFEGDDTFRTVQGVWHENILKPSYKKGRPDDGNFIEIGRIDKISPKIVRDLTLDNVYNGAEITSGVSESDWAKQIADRLGLLSKWNSGSKWQYVHPPQYTVGPDRTVFMMPKMSFSKSSAS